MITFPNVNLPPMPALADPGVILNGQRVEHFTIDSGRGYPDVRSFRRKFGLLIPATNTSMEHELWTIILTNAGAGLDGIGLHTSNVVTPSPRLASEADPSNTSGSFRAG
jgi:maleate isomerase